MSPMCHEKPQDWKICAVFYFSLVRRGGMIKYVATNSQLATSQNSYSYQIICQNILLHITIVQYTSMHTVQCYTMQPKYFKAENFQGFRGFLKLHIIASQLFVNGFIQKGIEINNNYSQLALCSLTCVATYCSYIFTSYDG